MILELFYATGVRISELISIKINNIQLEEGIIHIVGKRNKERIVMIGSEAKDALRNYIAILHQGDRKENSEFLFPSLRNRQDTTQKHIAQRTVFNVVKKYLVVVSDDEKQELQNMTSCIINSFTILLDKKLDLFSSAVNDR